MKNYSLYIFIDFILSLSIFMVFLEKNEVNSSPIPMKLLLLGFIKFKKEVYSVLEG